ncbi:Nto1p Ecym_4650 [Eremothecium cymbalariae DBVPG|uniref:PHD-type domain-containing protein n=1 Tax=Eremothecium cymbalariae (strain CBS 270.75 / DBVPG 7215 / KCTC 17166 / NRRL Y-17582) TaxID=931890 RepID=G8JSF1_ERECY|nr:hypothetical protein Ecym_4650 [Eremothecium cymbalariae DBVPG\
MSHGKIPLRARDEGPKLREEKSYTDFYPELNHHELLPLILERDNEASGTSDLEDGKKNSGSLMQGSPLKQIIFNNKVTVEPLGPQLKKTCFRPCRITISQLNGKYKVSSQFQKYGYRSNMVVMGADVRTMPYLKKTDNLIHNENDYFINISPHLKDFQVEYDMDEQDDLYLQFLNNTRLKGSKKLLNHEIFEIIMTILETEWFHLEKKIPQRSSTNVISNSHESRAAWAHFELYGSDDGSGYSVDQPCAICGGTDSDTSNAIVFCDGCDVAVHQECYGVVFIPEGQWLCRRCMISKNRKINCLFCPSHTGAFKQTDTGSWGHVICAIWIPELFFANIHYMEPIEGIYIVPKSRWRLNCYICKQKVGACIQCANKNCFAAYHVTCAKRAGLFMNFGGCTVLEAASKNFRPGMKLESFCDKHSPSGWGDCQIGIIKARRYFRNIKEVMLQESNKVSQLDTHQDTKIRWKTNRSTPIAPNLFIQVVNQVVATFDIPDSEKLAIDLCKYWSMKRELKRGAPLVRKFDPSSFNTLGTVELQKRIDFAEVLLKDLNKLEELSHLLEKRQQAALLKDEAKATINNIWFHPVRYLLQKNVTPLWETKDFQVIRKIEPEFANILRKVEDDEYPSITAFSHEVTSVFDRLFMREDTLLQINSKLSICQRKFNKQIAKIDKIDIHKLLSRDFTFDGNEVREVAWSGPLLMKEEELSEIEEEFTPAQERMLKALLR